MNEREKQKKVGFEHEQNELMTLFYLEKCDIQRATSDAIKVKKLQNV